MPPLTTLAVSPFLLPLSIRSLLFLFAIGGGGGGLPEGEGGTLERTEEEEEKESFRFQNTGWQKYKNKTLLTCAYKQVHTIEVIQSKPISSIELVWETVSPCTRVKPPPSLTHCHQLAPRNEGGGRKGTFLSGSNF